LLPTLDQILDRLGASIGRRPRTYLLTALLASALAAAMFAFLRLDQDISSLFPQGDGDVEALEALRTTLAGTNFALVLLGASRPDPELLKEASDALGGKLRNHPDIHRVRWRITEEERRFYSESFLERGLLFLPPEALDDVRERLTPGGMEREVAECGRLLDSPLPQVEERILHDPLNLFEDVFLPVMKHRSQGAKLDFETGHTLSADGRACLLQVWGKKSPRDLEYARGFAGLLRGEVRALLAEPRFSSAGLQARITGGYEAALRNERSVKRNLMVSFIGAFVGVLLLFTVAFRSVRVNLTVGLPLVAGTLAAFGLASLVLSFRMTAIAAAFGAILVGLGIDLPIHLYHRFREASAGGASQAGAVRASLSKTGPGVVSAALTTALAFGLLALADFRGMIEVGVFVGLGILALLAIMLTLLPALFMLLEKPARRSGEGGAFFGLRWLETLHRRAGIVLFVLALTAGAAALADIAVRGGVPFESDVRALRSPSKEADEANAEIGERYGLSLNPILAVAVADTRSEALDRASDADALLEPLLREGLAVSILGPGAFHAGPLRTARARTRLGDIDPEEVARFLEGVLDRHEFEPEAFRDSIGRLKTSLACVVSPAGTDTRTEGFDSLLEPFLAENDAGVLAVTVLYAPVSATSAEHLALGARAKELLEGRLGEGGVVTSVDLLVQRLKTRVLVELSSITLWVAGAVVLIAIVHFRSPVPAFLALLPAAFGFGFTLSVMKLTGLRLNFMNVVVLPMILGIGVDDGIHFVHRWREKGLERWREALHGAGMPILMTTLTSMAGFGSLVLADNPGLRSVGWVALIGLSACMIFTLMLLPFLCRLAERKEAEPGGGEE